MLGGEVLQEDRVVPHRQQLGGVTRAQIDARYGARVAEIVDVCTDTTERPKPRWRPRKEAHIAKVRHQPPYAKLVVAADKMHNALCILRDRRRDGVGHRVWNRFSADRQGVLWYYRAMSEALAEGWEHALAAELRVTVDALHEGD